MKIKTELNEKETFTMTRDEFITEYHSVSARALQLSKKARREGLLALEEMINHEKVKQRDILEYGLRFVVDGTDASLIRDVLENIIEQEEDEYARKLMILKEEIVLSVQAGDNTRILAYKLNSFTSLSLEDDPIIQEIMKEDDKSAVIPGEGALSSDFKEAGMMHEHEKPNNSIPTRNVKSWTVKDWAKAVYEEKRSYKEAKAFLGPSKVQELLKEISELEGCPVSDLDTPEGLERLEIFIRGEEKSKLGK
jgi:hypothetical protein